MTHETHWDDETGTLRITDELIQPKDYETGHVGTVRFNMEEMEREFQQFLLFASIEDTDLELACFTMLQAMEALGKNGELHELVGHNILSISGSLYKAMLHNESIPSDERTDPSAE